MVGWVDTIEDDPGRAARAESLASIAQIVNCQKQGAERSWTETDHSRHYSSSFQLTGRYQLVTETRWMSIEISHTSQA